MLIFVPGTMNVPTDPAGSGTLKFLVMSFHTVVKNKKMAVGLVRTFRAHCLLARFEEIPTEYRIATDRRYMVFVMNPGQEDSDFAERCEKIIAKYNQ